jgi:ribosomal protein L40E
MQATARWSKLWSCKRSDAFTFWTSIWWRKCRYNTLRSSQRHRSKGRAYSYAEDARVKIFDSDQHA